MSTWKNIVVEDPATSSIAQNVSKAGGFSGVLPREQGSFESNGAGAFNNNYGIWDTAADAQNLTPILLNRGGIYASTPTIQNSVSYGQYPIDEFLFGRDQVYMLATVPLTANGVYTLWPNQNGASDEDAKPYYWYEYGSANGPLSVAELTANTIAISPIADGAITTDVTVPDNVTFTATGEGATWTVNGTLDLTSSDISDANTLASLAAWSDSGGNTVTDEDTITFNPGGSLDDLEANSNAHFSSGFRAYNVDTKSVVENLNMGMFYYADGDDHVDILGSSLDIEDLTEGGWTLTWSKLNANGVVTNHTLSGDTIVMSETNDVITLTQNANTPTEEWNHISSFLDWYTSGEQTVTNIKLTAINKKSVQFGITCESSLADFEFNRGAIYPSFHSMCGQVNLDVNGNTLHGGAYAVNESLILTNSGSETDSEKTFTGAIAVVSEKPQIRIDVNL